MHRLTGAPLACALLLAHPAVAGEADDIVVTAPAADQPSTPATMVTVDAARIAATTNVVNFEDALRYLPSLLVRKRHIGDTQAPLATRTSGVGASARSLVYADGALLSALIGNNNSTASPRWGLVSPEEVARIDVLYGPFSAAYPGNSIGAVVNITTRMPAGLEATARAQLNLQRFGQYGTQTTLPSGQLSATLGDRFGPLSLFASVDHVVSNGQPLAYATATRPAAPGTAGTPATGAVTGVNRLGQPIAILGAGGIEHLRRDTLKLKAAFDVAPELRLTYAVAAFLNDIDSTAASYLRGPAGQPLYAGTFNIGGYAYTVPASTFANNVYAQDQRHWSHTVSLVRDAPAGIDWRIVATLYDYARDTQRIPGAALPAAFIGGAGSILRMDGTGWRTLDADAGWTSPDARHHVRAGGHYDRFTLDSRRFATTDWITGGAGALTQSSAGRTATSALWVEDGWRVAGPVTLTAGLRQEWWRAFDGRNVSAGPVLDIRQPRRRENRLSPKATLAFAPAGPWSATLSLGRAWRFPTVTELYQAIATGPSITVPDPTLRPERATSAELALAHRDAGGEIRLSLFREVIADALLSQSAPLVPGSATLYSYVQNVDRVRTNGVELAVDRRDVLPGFDLAGSVTLVDPRITADTAFAAAVGKRPPQLPVRRATLVATWRPDPALSLTGAVRYASRSFATIDNIDTVADTYQGFAGYVVADLRARVALGRNWTAALGVENLTDRRYFLFHPFPARSFSAELGWRF